MKLLRRGKDTLHQYKYELLLFGLVQHLFIGIFITDLRLYQDVIWPLNMLILGILSIGIFIEKGKWKNRIRTLLFICIVALPIGLAQLGSSPSYFIVLSVIYVSFFLFVLWEVMRFLLRPSYINIDIFSAAGCGYLLLVEVFTFTSQFFYYQDSSSYQGVSSAATSETYIDFVYFSSITITSIGYGDIMPVAHYAKLLTSFFGIVGQFYSVMLVGILISKFVSKQGD